VRLRSPSARDHDREITIEVPINALDPMVTAEGMVRAPVSPLQPLNAYFPIVVTAEGMVRAPVSPLQALNAYFPIVVTAEPMVRAPVSPLQP
jgi:hypothetical protein